jgi:formylglycine-generating enzyme required for sulfatase activity
VKSSVTPRWPQAGGRLMPNDLGLFDMFGNAREWCEGYYAHYGNQDVGSESAIGDSNLADPRSRRVVRGGSFLSPPGNLRASDRDMNGLSMLTLDVGFRVARTER